MMKGQSVQESLIGGRNIPARSAAPTRTAVLSVTSSGESSDGGVQMIGGENENNGSCGGNSGVEKVGTNGGDSVKPFGAKSGMGGGRIKSGAGEFVVSEGVSHGNTE